jgi:GT2 family glycosyltransferase
MTNVPPENWVKNSQDQKASWKKVPVIIPHFRAPKKLEKCLAAISAQKNISTEVFVRDNSEDNILFTKAINEGLKKFAYLPDIDAVLVLNQDAYLQENCLQHLLATMRDNPKAGIVIPIALNEHQQATSFAALAAYPWGVSRGGQLTQVPKTTYGTYWANGACMLLRTQMIREIGLLDENMRFICSDADYSFTARSRHWEVLVEPTAIVEHSLGSSGQITPPWLEEVKLSDQLYFAQKWLNGDLYRSLSFEGKALSAQVIDEEIGKTKALLQLVRQRLNPEP